MATAFRAAGVERSGHEPAFSFEHLNTGTRTCEVMLEATAMFDEREGRRRCKSALLCASAHYGERKPNAFIQKLRDGDDIPVSFDNHPLGLSGGWAVAGWIATRGLKAMKDGLHGTISWTTAGKEALKRKQYHFVLVRFQIDAVSGSISRICGVSLVNRPAINLPALRMSPHAANGAATPSHLTSWPVQNGMRGPLANCSIQERKVKTMTEAYPFSVLNQYPQVVDSISTIDEVTVDVSALLTAIADEAEGDNRGEIIAALARSAGLLSRGLEEAWLNISEYCRAADVAYEQKFAGASRNRAPSAGHYV